MSRAAINSNVKHLVDDEVSVAVAEQIKARRKARYDTMDDFCLDYGITVTAFYDRLNDPDRFTVGELRELRHTLGMNKAELVEWLRPLL